MGKEPEEEGRGSGNLHSQIAESSLRAGRPREVGPRIYRAIELSRGLFNVIGQINLKIPDWGSSDVRSPSFSLSRSSPSFRPFVSQLGLFLLLIFLQFFLFHYCEYARVAERGTNGARTKWYKVEEKGKPQGERERNKCPGCTRRWRCVKVVVLSSDLIIYAAGCRGLPLRSSPHWGNKSKLNPGGWMWLFAGEKSAPKTPPSKPPAAFDGIIMLCKRSGYIPRKFCEQLHLYIMSSCVIFPRGWSLQGV